MRLRDIRTYSPEVDLVMTVEGGFELERRIHEVLKEWRVGGEWFRDCPECREALEKFLGIKDSVV